MAPVLPVSTFSIQQSSKKLYAGLNIFNTVDQTLNAIYAHANTPHFLTWSYLGSLNREYIDFTSNEKCTLQHQLNASVNL